MLELRQQQNRDTTKLLNNEENLEQDGPTTPAHIVPALQEAQIAEVILEESDESSSED